MLRWPPRARLWPDSRRPWPPFDTASEQDRPTQRNKRAAGRGQQAAWTVRAARSRAVYRGIRAVHRIAAAFVARTSLPLGAGAESSDYRRMEYGKPCACVSPELTSSGEPFKFVAAARENLAAGRGQAIATHTARQKTFKF